MSNPIPKRLKLPVQLVNGRWEFFYGGAVPVAEGTHAEMMVESAHITDKDFLERVTQHVVTQCLPRGTELMVALSVPDQVGHDVFWYGWWGAKKQLRVNSSDLPSASTRFVPVTLGAVQKTKSKPMFEEDGGLWMVATGLGDCDLHSSTVVFPEELEMDAAISLNTAFTKLSERFEIHRLHHTGNVYTRVFYKESNETWYPLVHLKNGALERAEHAVMAAGWQALESQLGWCKFPRPDREV